LRTIVSRIAIGCLAAGLLMQAAFAACPCEHALPGAAIEREVRDHHRDHGGAREGDAACHRKCDAAVGGPAVRGSHAVAPAAVLALPVAASIRDRPRRPLVLLRMLQRSTSPPISIRNLRLRI
jgi:hypothetical protein